MAISKIILNGVAQMDLTADTVAASNLLVSYTAHGADGEPIIGAASGGGGATQHTIHLELSGGTDTDIDVYYSNSFVGGLIAQSQPKFYDNKLVESAELDGVEWYSGQDGSWTTLVDSTYATNDGGFWVTTLGDVYPAIGTEWRITIDGVSYSCTASGVQNQYGSTIVFIGNPSYAEYPDDGSNIPFCFCNFGYGAWNGYSNFPTGTYSLKIERFDTIPIGVELIDYSKVVHGYVVDDNTGEEVANEWSCCSDFTLIDASMTFSYIGYEWYGVMFFDESKDFVGSLYMHEDADEIIDGYAHGTITPSKIPSGAIYVRINTNPNTATSSTMSLIRTA